MIFDKSLFALGVDGGSKEPPIYLDRNGITIKAAEWAKEREFYTLSLGEGLPEETYYVWPNENWTWRSSLQQAMRESYDSDTDTVLLYDMGGRRIKVGNIVTSKLTNFNSMFSVSGLVPPPSSGVSRWDVSNVEYIINVLNSTWSGIELPRIEYWNLSSCKMLNQSFGMLKPHQIPDLSRWRLADGAQIELPSDWPENFRPRNSGPKHGTLQVELETGERVFIEELNTPVNGVSAVLEGSTVKIKSDSHKLSKIIDWLYIGGAENNANSIQLGDTRARSLTEAPNYLPDWVTSLRSTFYGSKSLNSDVDLWLTNKVKDFSNAFRDCYNFNGKGVETFNMYSAVTLQAMMQYCVSWNPEKIEWVPHLVKSAGSLFWGCTLFNPDVSKLHLPVCNKASYMFAVCKEFNQPVEHIFSQELDTLSSTFQNAIAFNQPLSNLPTKNVTNMEYMLKDATSFNQDLSGMCVPKITEKPNNFDTGATSWTLPRPVWGTCPSG